VNAYEKILESFPSKVSLGYETICIYRGSERESGQVGYSVSPGGDSLTGDGDGHWHAHWIVIGYEELCGDPIFIDAAGEGFPVYTAPHGEGRWDATPIAVSLESFGKSLSAIAQIAKDREFPTALEMNPLTEGEKETTIAAIKRENPGLNLEFWETLLQQS